MADYVTKVGAVEIGGVDRNGDPHKPIVFANSRSVVSIPDDDGQTYDQTLKHALDAGTIKLKPTKE